MTMQNISLQQFFQSNLTNSQLAAVKQLELFLKSKDQCFLLTGYAGTGKTFLLKQLSEYFNTIEQSYCFLAPTGRAAKVIRERTNQPATTIHSQIYVMDENRSKMNMTNDKEDYKLCFNLRKNDDPTNIIYIIDESSMISDKFQDNETLTFGSGKLLTDLITYVQLHETKRKILFIGDAAQLPPVQSNISPALSKEYLQKTFNLLCQGQQLTNVYRQSKESEILLQATQFRTQINRKDYDEIPLKSNGIDLKELTIPESITQYVQRWKRSVFIAATNSNVFQYNKSIRQSMGLDKLTINERLLVTRNCMIQNIPLFNGDFVYTKRVSPNSETRTVWLKQKGDTLPVTLTFRDLIILVESEGKRFELNCKIIENHLYRSDRDLSSLELRALIADFTMRHPNIKQNSDLFKQTLSSDPYFNALQVKFGYAMTCHKSQGGEWKEVFIDFDFYQSVQSEQFFRWGYTALTRSKEQLYLVNIPNNDHYLKKQDYNNQDFSGVNATVRKICNEQNFTIEDIQYHDYQVLYTIETTNNRVRIALWRNAENIITNFTIIDNNENEDVIRLTEIFNYFKGKAISSFENKETTSTVIPIVKTDLLLNDLRSALKKIDVKIKSISFHDFLIKYTFGSNESECTINFYYNKTDLLTKSRHENGDAELTKKVLKCLGINV
jgi:hypothetical protein